ncbi:MAG: hypothetical protein C4581_05065 [Nitrospiraceae bacterium]|nr:MAG: hypothetical protein C4581_05065 [Nitrospiraceae bacterium]
MKHSRWQILLGLLLVAMSALFYSLHYVIFKDSHHIFIYLLGDIAFVPIEVLLVTMIIHKLLEERERKSKMEKLNMVIETFFSAAGTEVLAHLSDCDPKLDNIRQDLIVTGKWTDNEFNNIRKRLRVYDYTVNISKIDLKELRSYMIDKREFFLRLLENPAILEHESFTELLRAIFHLTEELINRDDTSSLPDTDYEHLGGDIHRVYGLLVKEWLEYMKYLKNNYPYLFSLAMRTNPFDRTASPIVR